MADAIIGFFSEHISAIWLVGIIISMIPLVELKGAIPAIYAMLVSAGHSGAAAIWTALGVSVAGSGILAPILLAVLLPVISWLKGTKLFRKPALWVERHFRKKSDKLEQKAENSTDEHSLEQRTKKSERIKYWGLFTFTAIPLPLTGVWTASAVAAFLHLDYKKSLLFIELGNVLAGVVVALVTFFIGDVLL